MKLLTPRSVRGMFLWPLVASVVVVLPGVLKGLASQWVEPQRLTPELDVIELVCAVLLLTVLVASITSVVRGRTSLAKRRRPRMTLTLGLVSAVMVSLAAFTGMIAANLNLFEPTFIGIKQQRPDGGMTYLFKDADFITCGGYELWTRPANSYVMTQESDVSVDCKNIPRSLSLKWDNDTSQMRIVKSDGTWLGPHRGGWQLGPWGPQ